MVLESSGWTMYDTVACVLAIVLVSGYLLMPVQHLVVTALDLVFSPIVKLVPFSLFFFGLAGVTGISSTVIRHRVQDSEQLDRLQSRITELQAELSTAHHGDDENPPDALPPEQEELVSSWVAMMKLQLRPLVWSMLVTVPIFLWLRWALMAPTAAAVPVALTLPVLGPITLSATLVGPVKVWLAFYIGGSISTSVLSKRALARVTA